MKKKRIMDAVWVRDRQTNEMIVLDFIPCPQCSITNDISVLPRAVAYYEALYPDHYVDVDCNNK